MYVGTCLGDFPLQHEVSLSYDRAQRRWNRFWCGPDHNPRLADYRARDTEERARLRRELGAPDDPDELDPEHPEFDTARDDWLAFWVEQSQGLRKYLEELRQIEAEGILGDVETEKGHVIRRKLAAPLSGARSEASQIRELPGGAAHRPQ